MEEVEADPRSGVIRTDNYDTYLLPTALDACPFCVEFLEHPDASSPFGAKSLGPQRHSKPPKEPRYPRRGRRWRCFRPEWPG